MQYLKRGWTEGPVLTRKKDLGIAGQVLDPIWLNYDLTATSVESWSAKGIIPK
jgi:hypothetical protein